MTLIAELDSLIKILEAEIPANPESPANEKLIKRLQISLSKYFDKLERAFPYSKLSSIYNKYVIKESLDSETRGFLDPMLATFSKAIEAEIAGQLAEIYISGQAEMITWGVTKGGIPIAFEGPPISNAVSWAGKHSATMVTQMDIETKRRLAQVVSDGIANKRGVPGLARDIRNSFDNMSKYRSEL
ncbi:unnamed protein product, partial [marine sediment metagenome]